MSTHSLDALTIDKTLRNAPRRKSGARSRFAVILVVVLAVGAAVVTMVRKRSITIETATVSLFYPTQSF
ncbi:MAG: hypothetical protein WCL71_16955, partial [Deltaproteobacteria bacterium]